MLNLRGQIIEQLQHDLAIQFQRIAQIQVELDEVRVARSKIKPISKS